MRLVYSSASATMGLLLLWIALFERPDLYLDRTVDGLMALTGTSGRAAVATVRNWLDGVETEAAAAAAPAPPVPTAAKMVIVPGSLAPEAPSAASVRSTEQLVQRASASSEPGAMPENAAPRPSPMAGPGPTENGATPAAETLLRPPPAPRREPDPPRTESDTSKRLPVAKRFRRMPLQTRVAQWWQDVTTSSARSQAAGGYNGRATAYGLAGGGG